MSSADRDGALAGELIERLLVDPEFRADFRRDPAAACLAAGLPDLAEELAASAGSIDTLAVRESRSSLAGAVLAVAVEGMSVAEAQALIHHGLTGAPRGLAKLSHGGALRRPSLGHVHGAASPAALGRELHGLRGGSPGHGAASAPQPTTAPPPSHPATTPPSSAAATAPPPSHPATAPPSSNPATAPAPSEPAGAAPSTPETTATTPPPSDPATAPSSSNPATAAPPPPDPGAQPARGGVVPVWPDQHPAGAGAGPGADPRGADGAVGAVGSTGAAPAAIFDSPQLSAPPDVRAFLTGGGADPRLVGVLSSALASHSIGLGQVTSLTDPLHAQALSIVSVDGQPVGPNNFAARDLVTEIAALDPGQGPDEIGTPWPIHAQGFFSDPGQQGQIHLAFLTDEQPASANGAAPLAATPAAPPATPAAATPAAPDATPATANPDAPPAATSAPAAGAPPGSSQYVNPLPASARIGRTDMGVDADLNPGDPIVAPGTSRVLGISPNWYRGQPYVALQLLDGPMKGHNYFLAEQITPNVSAGQIVQRGQPIAHYAASGTGIEIGWAGPNWEQTLAQATTGYREGEQTPAGASFRNFLDGLGHGTPADAGPGAAGAPQPAAPPPDSAATPPADATTPAPPESTAAPPADPTPLAPDQPAEPAPATTPFTVLESRHRGPVRHTVQFLPAVQPSPESPLYGQAPIHNIGASPHSAQPPTPDTFVDHAPGTPGGSVSVTSSLLTSGQAKFAGRLAELTGLDPRVVAAWELAEESGGAAQAREAASNFNWLNIGYFDSGAGGIAFDKTFSDPISAAEQSAKFLKGEWGGASPSIRAILNSVGHSPNEQMAAIANSDWASSHYGGGANLHGTYDELADIHVDKTTMA